MPFRVRFCGFRIDVSIKLILQLVLPISKVTHDWVHILPACTGRYKSRTGLWSGSDQVGSSRIRSDQVGLGRIFRKFRNIRIFREMLLTQTEVCILSRVIYTA
jgi:hypothetical protein